MPGILYLDRGGHVHPHVEAQRAPAINKARKEAKDAPPSRSPHGGFNVPDPERSFILRDEPSKPIPKFITPDETIFGIGYHPGQVDPGLAIATIGKPGGFHESYTPSDIHGAMTGGFDVTYPGPSQPDAGITGDGTVTTTDDTPTTGDGIDVNEVIKKIPGMVLKGVYGGAMGIKALLDKLFKPELSDFSNPNFLAVMNAAFKSGEVIKDDYVTKYQKLISEALGSPMDEEEAFYKFDDLLEESYASAVAGDLGKSVQQNVAPKEYYGEYGMPQTIGELEDLARMDATKYPGTDLAQMIFDARAELDRQQGAGDVGGGAGIMGAVPTPFTDVNNNGILDSLEVAQATTTPAEVAATTTTPAATTTATATTPTPFDYSQWPQFTSAYPGYNQYSGPNYVNQGLGQWPDFDYWNQIANTFPGMSQYG